MDAAARDSFRVENNCLIWLDQDNEHYRSRFTELQNLFDVIKNFADIESCLKFLNDTTINEKMFMISSGSLGQLIVPQIHHFEQIESIFIFCMDRSKHKKWADQWSKIEDVYTDMTSLYKAIEDVRRRNERNSVCLSFLRTEDNDDFEQIDNQMKISFMYTQILADILLKIDFKKKDFNELITYSRSRYENKEKTLTEINDFERLYNKKDAIYWYTRDYFPYPMLNKALREMDIEVILKMGFFIRDLHQQIQCCHSKQCHKNQLITLYRGQYLLEEHFKQLCQTQGGLLTFNNFLSTTTEISKALWFVQHKRSGQVGIFFTITPHQLLSSTPFASIDKFSEHPTEKEVLFSMHTIFRIENVEFCPTNQIWKVELTQTTLNNHELYALTKCLGDTIAIERFAEYDRLGRFFIQMSKFDQAQHVYQKMLLDSKVKDFEKANIYHQLGRIQDKQGQQQQAIDSYIKCITILEKHNSKYANDLALAYNSMGALYTRMANYAEALTFYNKALTIQERNLHGNHLDIADTKNNIGILYKKTNDLRKAENYLNEALQIRERVGPACNPNIVQSYYNLSLLYEQMQDRDREIVCLDKAVSIGNQCLPKDHPFLQKINAKKRTYRA